MKKCLGVSVWMAGLCVAAASADLRVGALRCEYAENPLGVRTLAPHLSWTLVGDGRGQRQTACQIRVAASVADLESERSLLWDSGKAVSSQSLNVPYAGPALRAGSRCYWQVRAWDQDGRPTAWSAPAFWQVALLEPADWSAQWIGEPGSGAPGWTDLTLAADVTLQKEAAGLVFRAQDGANFYMWQLNAVIGPEPLLRPHIQKNGGWSMLPAVSLGRFLSREALNKPHRVEIALHGTKITTRLDGQVVDEREDATFASGTVGFRADSKEAFLVDNLLVADAAGQPLLRDDFAEDRKSFPGATLKDGALAVSGAALLHRPPLSKACPRMRKDFALDKPVLRVSASVCGLGFYELYLNGAKAGDGVLAPPNTPYGQRVLFDTLDVTPLVKPGANAVGLWLAPGYSDDYSRWGWKWEEPKRALVQLDVLYADGTSARVCSDATWRCGASPLTFASLYDGEVCDARLEEPGWDRPGFRDGAWKPVAVLAPPRAALAPNSMPPLRVVRTLRPVGVAEPKPGVFVFDMGQNFAGWVRLAASGPRGTTVTVRHSERVGPDGLLDPWTNRRAKATDSFTLAGEGVERYEPRFTYHGFRYVEVTGYPGRPTLDDVTGCVVHADVRPEGRFACSDETLNRIASNCAWSMRSNFMGIPTDCCMRDERTPCQMDSLAYEESALYAFDMNRFYNKWLDDIEGGRGNPDWNGDAVFLPWRLYTFTGDRGALERHYANMRDLVDHLAKKTPGHVYSEGFGDWCPPNDGSWESYHGDVTEVNTCLYAELARIASESAALLGKADDTARFSALSAEIARAFHRQRFHAETSSYGDGSQTTALMPLAFGLVPREAREVVGGRLVKTIREKDKGHVDTGIFGTRYLVDVLCDIGQADLAVEMLKQPGYPGFAFQLENGATTLWEQWTIKGGMNSHNHAMFAGVLSSFYSRLAGIRPLKPGFEEIAIQPVMPRALAFAEAEVQTVRGRVFARWQREGARVTLAVSVPVGATAVVTLPVGAGAAVTEGGRPAAQSEGVVRVSSGVFRVASGDYEFGF